MMCHAGVNRTDILASPNRGNANTTVQTPSRAERTVKRLLPKTVGVRRSSQSKHSSEGEPAIRDSEQAGPHGELLCQSAAKTGLALSSQRLHPGLGSVSSMLFRRDSYAGTGSHQSHVENLLKHRQCITLSVHTLPVEKSTIRADQHREGIYLRKCLLMLRDRYLHPSPRMLQ